MAYVGNLHTNLGGYFKSCSSHLDALLGVTLCIFHNDRIAYFFINYNRSNDCYHG